MDVKKFVFAFLGGFIVMFLLSGLWHQILMKDFYSEQAAEIMREVPDMIPITLGLGVLALLMAYIYPIGFKGGAPWMEGLRFGVIIGLLWILPFSLVLFGVAKMTLSLVLVDSGWHILEQGIGGIAIGLLYGKIKK